MKQCYVCKKDRNLSDFYRGNCIDGLRGTCKQCYRNKYLSDTEKYKENRRKNYEKNKETILTKGKIYREKNKEKINRRRKLYRSKNKQKNKERMKRWVNTERGRMLKLLGNVKRRIIQKTVDDKTITVESVKSIWTGKCKKCHIKIVMEARRGETYHCHLDHIIPISRGGTHSILNVQWLCAFCNMSKHDKYDN